MMANRRVDITAMFSTGSGAACITQPFSTDNRLEDVIVWARSLETGGRRLVEVICDLRARGADS
ncbi:MAG: hypothetical protein ACFCUQ_11920 [Kiloniellales bacterium]